MKAFPEKAAEKFIVKLFTSVNTTSPYISKLFMLTDVTEGNLFKLCWITQVLDATAWVNTKFLSELAAKAKLATS